MSVNDITTAVRESLHSAIQVKYINFSTFVQTIEQLLCDVFDDLLCLLLQMY